MKGPDGVCSRVAQSLAAAAQTHTVNQIKRRGQPWGNSAPKLDVHISAGDDGAVVIGGLLTRRATLRLLVGRHELRIGSSFAF